MHCAASGSSAPGSSEVPEMAEPSKTEQRKAEHVNIILNENVSAEYNYWNDVHLLHRAIPEIDLDDIDVSTTLLGRKLRAPLVISSMTGGFGMGREINANLAKGAAGIGVGGLWGTSFSPVEYYRAKKESATLKERLGATFWNWGIPTPASVVLARVGLPVIATGGVRSGLDVAKGIALGASAAGMAKPMLEAAKVSAEAVVQELRAVIEELKAAMFLIGASNLDELREARCIVNKPTADWIDLAGD